MFVNLSVNSEIFRDFAYFGWHSLFKMQCLEEASHNARKIAHQEENGDQEKVGVPTRLQANSWSQRKSPEQRCWRQLVEFFVKWMNGGKNIPRMVSGKQFSG